MGSTGRADVIKVHDGAELKAIVRDVYGSPDVLACDEVPEPVPKDGEVLVKIHDASTNPADWHSLRGRPYFLRLGEGLTKPKQRTLGIDLAGRVEALGTGVTRFRVGDEVFGATHGAFAEYACAGEDRLATKPEGVDFEQAASVPVAAVTALQVLRDEGRIQSGHRVLINGASGGVGTFAVQIAKAFEAEVTGVCSTRNLDLVRAIGADRVIDYTQEDCTQTGERYDVILDAAAYRSISDYRKVLGPEGRYVMVGGSLGQIFHAMLLGRIGKRMRFMMARLNGEDLRFLSGLLETRKILPVIDRRYPLDEVPEALRYQGRGHARGKVVITIS